MDHLANDGAAAPVDDLRSEIESAFKASETNEGPQPGEADTSAALTADNQQPGTVDRSRDPASGRFVAKTAAEIAAATNAAVADAAKAQQAAQQQPGQQQGAEQQARVPTPPPGWSVAGKAAFAALPDAVKNDVAKREDEISQGFAKLAEYKGLDPYVEMARGLGTTLPESLERYVSAEQFLERDPINGILWLCGNYNVHPAQLLEATGQGGHQPQPGQDPFAPVMEQFQTLDQRLSRFEQQQEQALDDQVNGQISAFASDTANKYFDNVRHDMGRLIAIADQTGKTLSLKDAYEQACWAHPEIRAALINEQNTARDVQARQKAESDQRSAKGLSPGSPVPGGTLAATQPASTLREEIERSFDAHRV